MLDLLKEFLDRTKSLRQEVKTLSARTIGSLAIRQRAEALGSEWCNEVCPQLLANGGFDVAKLADYSVEFERLIKLSAPSNLRTSYLSVLDSVTKQFRTDFILPIQQGKVAFSPALTSFDKFLTQIGGVDESDYLKEALSCAKHGYFRAATVMGWCAAIDRIHRKIEELGFVKFNVASARMASEKTGRFKKFNQTQNVNSLSEIREVFDTIVLWIVEGMELIDSNQHTRLHACFEMRCHAGHPGEAPTTEYNLLSFFSDIEQIVLSNPRFALKISATNAS